MESALLQRYVGRKCFLLLNAGGWGASTYKGTILAVEGDWLELQNKKRTQLLNINHISLVQPQVQ